MKYYIDLLKVKSTNDVVIQDHENIVPVISKTMRRLDRLTFLDMTCLIKSCVFKSLLNASGLHSSLVLGVKFSNMQIMRAHAFVKLNGQIIYQEQEGFIEVYNVE